MILLAAALALQITPAMRDSYKAAQACSHALAYHYAFSTSEPIETIAAAAFDGCDAVWRRAAQIFAEAAQAQGTYTVGPIDDLAASNLEQFRAAAISSARITALDVRAKH